MTDLDEKEQKHVRTALLYLRRRVGAWAPVAKALRYEPESLGKVATGRRGVTAALALRVARFVGIGVDALLDGSYVPGACPKCGHVPDFGDEFTAVEEVARNGLSG